MFVGNLDDDMEVFHRPRNDHAKRLDAINAGVRAVEPAGGAVETHFALDGFLEVAFESLALQSVEVSRHSGIVRLTDACGPFPEIPWGISDARQLLAGS